MTRLPLISFMYTSKLMQPFLPTYYFIAIKCPSPTAHNKIKFFLQHSTFAFKNRVSMEWNQSRGWNINCLWSSSKLQKQLYCRP